MVTVLLSHCGDLHGNFDPFHKRGCKFYLIVIRMRASEDEEHLLYDVTPEDLPTEAGHGLTSHPSAEHMRNRRRLYISHALSTCNSRVFEFGAFLFLASIWPQSLLPASVYALARAASAALLSPWLGPYIDRSDRLKVVRLSIRVCPLSPSTSKLLMRPSWPACPRRHFLYGFLASHPITYTAYFQHEPGHLVVHLVGSCMRRETQCSHEHHRY